MVRTLLAILAVALQMSAAHATDYTDWWTDPALTGTSINIAQQGEVVFAAWYLYDGNHRSKWLVGSGPIVNDQANVDLYDVTAPFLGSQSQLAATKVGTGTFVFQSTGSVRFQYNTASEGSGTLNLSRFTFQSLPLAGSYYGGYVTRQYNCTSNANNGFFTGTASYSVSVSGSSLSVSENTSSGTCTYTGPFSQYGSRFEAQGDFACTNGVGGTWKAKDGLIDNGRLLVEIDSSIPNMCDVNSHVAAVLNSRL